MSRQYMPVAKTIVHGTPDSVFCPLDQEFRFTVDVCALPSNTKCERFFSPEQDGLAQDWSEHVCWMNPPYGRECGRWMEKAYRSSLEGATVVALVPVRSDVAWWHEWVVGKAEVRFIRGRVKFEGMVKDAPFPCAIVIFRPTTTEEGGPAGA